MTQFRTHTMRLVVCLAILSTLSACSTTKDDSRADHPATGLPFAEATMILEHNASDDDAEIVLFVKGGDEGLASLRVIAPDDSVMLDLTTDDRTVGLREFGVESAEPGLTDVTGAFPEGSYRLEGVTISGDALVGTTTLSHSLPAQPELTVDLPAGTVTWTASADAAMYSIELERELNDVDEMAMTMELPADVTSFAIPAAFRVPGDYQVGIAVHGANGNITVIEHEFTIDAKDE